MYFTSALEEYESGITYNEILEDILECVEVEAREEKAIILMEGQMMINGLEDGEQKEGFMKKVKGGVRTIVENLKIIANKILNFIKSIPTRVREFAKKVFIKLASRKIKERAAAASKVVEVESNSEAIEKRINDNKEKWKKLTAGTADRSEKLNELLEAIKTNQFDSMTPDAFKAHLETAKKAYTEWKGKADGGKQKVEGEELTLAVLKSVLKNGPAKAIADFKFRGFHNAGGETEREAISQLNTVAASIKSAEKKTENVDLLKKLRMKLSVLSYVAHEDETIQLSSILAAARKFNLACVIAGTAAAKKE